MSHYEFTESKVLKIKGYIVYKKHLGGVVRKPHFETAPLLTRVWLSFPAGRGVGGFVCVNM